MNELHPLKKLTLDEIREKIETLSKDSPEVRIDLNQSRRKMSDLPARITAVYKNFFIVENNDRGYIARYTVQFGELLTGEVVIHGLCE